MRRALILASTRMPTNPMLRCVHRLLHTCPFFLLLAHPRTVPLAQLERFLREAAAAAGSGCVSGSVRARETKKEVKPSKDERRRQEKEMKDLIRAAKGALAEAARQLPAEGERAKAD